MVDDAAMMAMARWRPEEDAGPEEQYHPDANNNFFLHYAIIDILKSPFIGIDKGTEPYH